MERKPTASAEDYLETIALLCRPKGPVRVSQISKAMGVKMPSVSGALRRLGEDGLVRHERYGYVNLTAKGRRVAQEVLRRHETLRRFLTEVLSVAPQTAAEDACKIEHSVSSDTVNRLAKLMEFISTCPRGHPRCLTEFGHYIKHGERSPDGCQTKCSARGV